jgi:hypothetical protein
VRAGQSDRLATSRVKGAGVPWRRHDDGHAQAAEAFVELERRAAARPEPSRWLRPAPVAAVLVLGVAIGVVIYVYSPSTVSRLKQVESPLPANPVEPAQRAGLPPLEEKVQPLAPPPVPWSIASAEPGAGLVTGQENKPLTFAIKPTGGPPGTTAKVEWLIDGEPVQTDATEWTYKPDYDAAGDHTVEGKLDGGEGAEQKKKWTVQIQDVDSISAASPGHRRCWTVAPPATSVRYGRSAMRARHDSQRNSTTGYSKDCRRAA